MFHRATQPVFRKVATPPVWQRAFSGGTRVVTDRKLTVARPLGDRRRQKPAFSELLYPDYLRQVAVVPRFPLDRKMRVAGKASNPRTQKPAFTELLFPDYLRQVAAAPPRFPLDRKMRVAGKASNPRTQKPAFIELLFPDYLRQTAAAPARFPGDRKLRVAGKTTNPRVQAPRWRSDRQGWDAQLLDTDAQAYLLRVIAAGRAVTATERMAVDAWFKAGKKDAWYASIYDAWGFFWGAAGPNAVAFKNPGGGATFVGGTVNQDLTTFNGGTNGYANLSVTPAGAGQTAASHSLGFCIAGTISDGSFRDMGCDDGTTFGFQLTTRGFSQSTYDGGDSSTARVAGSNWSTPGLIIGSRIAGDMQIEHYAGGSTTTLGSRSDASGGGLPSLNYFLGAQNYAGSALQNSSRNFSFAFVGSGLTAPQRANFLIATWTLLSALGGTTFSPAPSRPPVALRAVKSSAPNPRIAKPKKEIGLPVGWNPRLCDTDAQIYLDRVAATGLIVTPVQRMLWDACFKAGKKNGWFNLYNFDGVFLGWGTAAANAVRFKSGSTISFVGGTTKHLPGYVQFGSNGYANLGVSPIGIGWGTSNCLIGFLTPAPTLAVGTGYDMGQQDASSTVLLQSNYTGGDNIAYLGNVASTLSSGGGESGSGLYIAARQSAIDMEISRYDGSNKVLATSSGGTSYPPGANNVYLGCQNNNGSAANFTNRAYSLVLWGGAALSSTVRAFMQVDLWTLAQAFGATSIPQPPYPRGRLPVATPARNIRTITRPKTQRQEIPKRPPVAASNRPRVDALWVKSPILNRKIITPKQGIILPTGWSAESADTDAQAYISRVIAAGRAVTGPEYMAIDAWVKAGKLNGWWSRLIDAGLLCWGSATPNGVKVINASPNVTFSGGTVVHNPNNWTGGAAGYADLQIVPSTAGMGTSGMGFVFCMTSIPTGLAGIADIGVFGTVHNVVSVSRNDGNFDSFRTGTGSFGTATVTSGAVSTVKGIYHGNRYSTSGIDLLRYDGAKTVLASTTSASGGGAEATSTARLGSGANGLYTSRNYTFWGMTLGMTQAIADYFNVDTWALLSALNATSIPLLPRPLRVATPSRNIRTITRPQTKRWDNP